MAKRNRSFRSFLPGRQNVSRFAALCLLFMMAWCSALLLIGDDVLPPNGQLWQLILLSVVAKASGWLVEQARLPGLLGMLIAGIVLQHVGFVSIEGKYLALVRIIRKVSLVVIMMRAGLDLDPKSVQKLKFSIMTLGWIPWAVEMCCVAAMSWWLFELSWVWALLLGAVEAAVSPAVVVPNLILLRERGFGVAKGVPTLVLAVTGIEDAISISAFGVISSFILSASSLVYSIIQGPLSVFVGILSGCAAGFLFKLFPDKDDPYVISMRIFMLLLSGLLMILGFDFVELPGAGPLAVIIAAFIAGATFAGQGWPVGQNQVALTFGVLWQFFEPIVFGMVGAQIKISELPLQMVGIATACVSAPALVRLLTTLVLLTGSAFNTKEKIFISIAWMAKATIQAVIGPAVVDMVRDLDDRNLHESANIVFIVCATSILLTAPIGAILIAVTGPRLLKKGYGTSLERRKVVRRQSGEYPNFIKSDNCVMSSSL